MSEFEAYQSEAQEKWGYTDAYKEHTEKTKNYSKDTWDRLGEKMDAILTQFAECMREGRGCDSAEAQGLVETLQSHITEHYYHCTKEILSGLGQLYVLDERFRKNIDCHGEGTAEFIRDAIGIYCGK